MPIQVHICREREPWGPGAWFAELLAGSIVVASTDYTPSRFAAIKAAEKLAASRGMEIR